MKKMKSICMINLNSFKMNLMKLKKIKILIPAILDLQRNQEMIYRQISKLANFQLKNKRKKTTDLILR